MGGKPNAGVLGVGAALCVDAIAMLPVSRNLSQPCDGELQKVLEGDPSNA